MTKRKPRPQRKPRPRPWANFGGVSWNGDEVTSAGLRLLCGVVRRRRLTDPSEGAADNERDYNQYTILDALHELFDDPRAHDVDARLALTVGLAEYLASGNEQQFAVDREVVLRVIKTLLFSIDPSPWRHKGETVDVIMTKIDKAIWATQ